MRRSWAAPAMASLIGLAGCSSSTEGPAEGDLGAPPDGELRGGDGASDGGPGLGPGDGGPEAETCYGAPAIELPERVSFRSSTQSFNWKWYVALQQGRIYFKPNTETGNPAAPWRLLGSGLPAGPGLTHFPAPTAVTEISGDGTWLHALSPAGVFYRGTDFTLDPGGLLFGWSDAWGHPAATGPGMVQEFATTHGWSISDSQRAGVGTYEDRLGTVHGVGNGVAHIYRLGPGGRTLHFNDWWLPNDWSRQICLPDRGTFYAENLSVSASTIFLVGARGELYTRLYDFDTSGENDTLTYSFLIAAPAGDTRALPAEEWRRQPDVADGLITRRITIFQDGRGNGARVLRVEGVRGGRTGYYQKRIFDPAWSFQETGQRVCGPFLNQPGRPAPPPQSPADRPLKGTLAVMRALGGSAAVELQLRNFNIVCSPAEATLAVAGKAVTVGGKPLVLPFHHVHSLTLDRRPTDYWEQGRAAVVRAALLVPASLAQIDDAAARQQVTSLLQSRKVVNFKGTASRAQVSLVEMTWLDPLVGVVPGNEKTDPGNQIKLELAP